MMAEDSPESEHHEAELVGLPRRDSSQGRDQLEVIASEYLQRLRSGEIVTIDEYIAREPHLADELRDFLQLVEAMEGWKSHQEIRSIQKVIPREFSFTHLGECRILREIARGGMGVVFEAEQGSIGRRVAIKLLPWKFAKKSRWAEQFQREARIVANLQHAHIVPIFSFGEQDDRYYYVMQLVEGVSLDRLVERWKRDQGVISLEDLIQETHPALTRTLRDQKQSKRLLRHDSWMQLAKIAAQVVSAVRYAHKQGTLHRDIKPGNLLIDVDGKIWITDFGLAIGQDHALNTESEPLAGTVRYMAPEQFYGEVDERSDLYAIGATLYELCTLIPAFQAPDRERLIDTILSQSPRPPRALNPGIPPELERIILKLMARKREDRYQTSDQLHADLLTFINPPQQKTLWQRLSRLL
ncbi:serine/threonine protein kinase [Planctomicrobium sp. SH664]|uniref:serine/threonine protein kinase n=1 Tax=Planctomicrobium sp. SH664 TaxID=3448125 RepID=UPI003F5AE488